MDSDAAHEKLIDTIHSLAVFYTGTPISEFKNMPILELEDAVKNMDRIAKIREKAMKR